MVELAVNEEIMAYVGTGLLKSTEEIRLPNITTISSCNIPYPDGGDSNLDELKLVNVATTDGCYVR